MAPKTTRYVAEAQPEEFDEADYTAYPDDPSDAVVEAGEPRCPACGELLAWHEEPCTAAPHPAPTAAPEMRVPSPSGFAYELGHQVLPATGDAPRTVTWRGQLKERHPETGMVHRVPVYRLDDGYWDCYREEELQVA